MGQAIAGESDRPQLVGTVYGSAYTLQPRQHLLGWVAIGVVGPYTDHGHLGLYCIKKGWSGATSASMMGHLEHLSLEVFATG